MTDRGEGETAEAVAAMSDCGVRKKALSLRRHDCECGCRLGRDEAAARVHLQWGLTKVAARGGAELDSGQPAGTVGAQAAA